MYERTNKRDIPPFKLTCTVLLTNLDFSLLVLCIIILQFDRERYVDGLLGIGAGISTTGSSGKNAGASKQAVNEEAKQLALRLQELRKEREERAKLAKATVGKQQQQQQQPFAIPQQQQQQAMNAMTSNSNNIAGVTPLSSGIPKPSTNRKKKSNNKKRKK